MIAAIKDWLPITKRNRVALGFAVAALVMFVVWNWMPEYISGRPVVMANIWIDIFDEFFDLDFYKHTIPTLGMDNFLMVAACISLLLNGLLVLAIVPFWKILHSSNYLRIPLAVANFAGGVVILWASFPGIVNLNELDESAPYVLMALTMFALSAALFIFKNELGLRHEREVKKMMSGGVSR